MSLPEIHISDVQLFKRCRRKWHFMSPLRLNLEPIFPDIKLWFGQAIHEALNDYYTGIEHPLDTFHNFYVDHASKLRSQVSLGADQDAEMLEHYHLGMELLKEYETYAKDADNFEVLYTEHEVRVPIRAPYRNRQKVAIYVGTLDLIVKMKVSDRDVVLIVDHKTSANRYPANSLALNEQLTAYTWAAKQAHPEYDFFGAMFNILLKNRPRTPKVLQNGTPTSAKNLLAYVTYERYLDKLHELGLDPKPYGKVLEFLRGRPNPFFQRDTVRRTTDEISHFERNLYYTVKDMVSSRVKIYPNPTRDCTWDCPCLEVCVAMNNNADWMSILDTQFRTRER